jgi:hypothetical protein
MHEQLKEQMVDRLSKSLTEALMLICQIPKGIHLVAILGTGLEADNREALSHWIRKYLATLDDFGDLDILGTLQDRLVADLESRWL